MLYRKQAWKLPSFFEALIELTYRENPHIILGDFNINAYQQNDHLSEVLGNYTLINDQPTHISGSLIDHMYIRHNFLTEVDVEVLTHCVYFSDHDAVKMRYFLK